MFKTKHFYRKSILQMFAFMLQSWSKDFLLFVFYCLTDYMYSRLHHRKRFINPVSAYSSATSNTLILLTLVICNYFWNKRVKFPRMKVKTLLISAAMSSIFRFNLFDFNHNFEAPSYKYMTVISLPLILYLQGADMYGCMGTFLTMLISSSCRNSPLPVDQALLGVVLSILMYMGLHYLKEKKNDECSEIDNLHQGSKVTIFLNAASEIFLGMILCDVFMGIVDGLQSRSHVKLGVDGIFLFTLAISAKFLLLFSDSIYVVHALVMNWVIKTIMFSFTYTLAYKFDLTVQNLLAILVWLLFVIVYTIMHKLRKSALMEVQYDPVDLSHTD